MLRYSSFGSYNNSHKDLSTKTQNNANLDLLERDLKCERLVEIRID